MFETFFDKTYLKNLYKKKLNDSKAKGIDKVNSVSFKKTMKGAIDTIVRKVENGSYTFSPYAEVLKLKGRNSKPRVVSIPTLRDRLVLLAVKEYLHIMCAENVSRKMPNSYIREIRSYIESSRSPVHFLKIDVEKFYDRINRSILLEKLRSKNIDPRAIELIESAINTPTVPANAKKTDYAKLHQPLGVPQGLSISNILAQIYVEEIDRILDKRTYFYQRYVDDILVLNSSPISGFRKKNIKTALHKIELSINDKKTEDGKLVESFTFLSYLIKNDRISIADKSVQVFIRRIAGKFTWYKNGISDKDKRPAWLTEKTRFQEVFIEELNELITGIISSKKNYGWLFYFSEMNDLNLLFKIDKVIQSFFKGLPSFKKQPPNNLKSLVRTYHCIKFDSQSAYLANYDNFDSIRKKRSYLVFRGKIDPAVIYSDFKIELLFKRFRKMQISIAERSVGYRYG